MQRSAWSASTPRPYESRGSKAPPIRKWPSQRAKRPCGNRTTARRHVQSARSNTRVTAKGVFSCEHRSRPGFPCCSRVRISIRPIASGRSFPLRAFLAAAPSLRPGRQFRPSERTQNREVLTFPSISRTPLLPTPALRPVCGFHSLRPPCRGWQSFNAPSHRPERPPRQVALREIEPLWGADEGTPEEVSRSAGRGLRCTVRQCAGAAGAPRGWVFFMRNMKGIMPRKVMPRSQNVSV